VHGAYVARSESLTVRPRVESEKYSDEKER
jgi:hypothetical protein